jgi:hypothetical protein
VGSIDFLRYFFGANSLAAEANPAPTEETKPAGEAQQGNHMPHLAATPPTSSAAALPTGAGRVAFRTSWTVPRPVARRLRLRARGVRREGGGSSVRTEEQETEATTRTFYDLLGISAEGSADEVRAAYRRLALKYHPDVSPPGAAAENTRRFIEVQEAYETLSDPSRRASYDRALARGVCRLAFSGSRSHRAYYHHQVGHRSPRLTPDCVACYFDCYRSDLLVRITTDLCLLLG